MGQFAIGDQRPRDVAVQIVASVQGALLTGRLTSDPYVIDNVAEETQELFGLFTKRHASNFANDNRSDWLSRTSLIERTWR